MKNLIIPDVHEKIVKLKNIDTSGYGRIIQLGDWFDAFGPVNEARVAQTCDTINDTMDDERFERLLGNHDVHYFFTHPGYKCSGYEPRKQMIIDRWLPEDVKRSFKIFTRVGPYLVSHAGFNEATLQYARPEVEQDALKTAFDGGYDAIFGAGRARGGHHKFGGPTWLDWNHEFEPITGQPQIVGHTQGKTVRTVTADDGTISYCIDTSLRHVAVVDDETGAVEILDVPQS